MTLTTYTHILNHTNDILFDTHNENKFEYGKMNDLSNFA